MGKINKDVYEREFIRAVLKNEAEKIDETFMNMGKEVFKIEVECECCGKRVKVSSLLIEDIARDLMKIFCPFCDKPLRLNIPLPEMIQ